MPRNEYRDLETGVV